MPRPHARRLPVAPLYDPQFEHDACGIGFVADAGGRNLDRVLPLALGGSGGARPSRGVRGRRRVERRRGVSLPLEPTLLDALAPGRGRRRPRRSSSLFLPRTRRGRRAEPRALVADALAAEGLDDRRLAARARRTRTRSVPRPPATRPDVRPGVRRAAASVRGGAAADLGRRLRTAPRHRPAAPRDRGPRGRARRRLAVPSASCRTIVYKGLVAGGRLADLYPDLGAGRSASRTPSSTSATRRTPNRPGGSPSHSARSPTTARSTPSAATGSRSAAGPATRSAARARAVAAEPRRRRPAPRRRRLRLAVARRDARAARRDRLGPRARRSSTAMPEALGAPSRAAPPGRDAPPRDRRLPRAVGRTGGDRLLATAAASGRSWTATACDRRPSP